MIRYKRRAAVAATIIMLIGVPAFVYLCRHPDTFLLLGLTLGGIVMLGLLWHALFSAAIMLQQELERKAFEREEQDMQREEEHPICCDPFSEEFEH